MNNIRLGTRGSRLALWQAAYVQKKLAAFHPGASVERVIIKTEGDIDQSSSLTQIGGQGVFTKALETALIDGKIDLAVHSLKDLPSKIPAALSLAAVPERGPAEDVIVTKHGHSLQDLPAGALVATGSIRRRSQLTRLRKDLRFTDLRGNIDTRLRKLEETDLDAILMAKAAVVRLGLDRLTYHQLEPDVIIPGVGQGAIGVQIRTDDAPLRDTVTPLNHLPTFLAVTAERAFLRELDSECQFPVGGYARINGQSLNLTGYIGSPDGTKVFTDSLAGDQDMAGELGEKLARKLLDQGADKLLDSFRDDPSPIVESS